MEERNLLCEILKKKVEYHNSKGIKPTKVVVGSLLLEQLKLLIKDSLVEKAEEGMEPELFEMKLIITTNNDIIKVC